MGGLTGVDQTDKKSDTRRRKNRKDNGFQGNPMKPRSRNPYSETTRQRGRGRGILLLYKTDSVGGGKSHRPSGSSRSKRGRQGVCPVRLRKGNGNAPDLAQIQFILIIRGEIYCREYKKRDEAGSRGIAGSYQAPEPNSVLGRSAIQTVGRMVV